MVGQEGRGIDEREPDVAAGGLADWWFDARLQALGFVSGG
jgi:hypothetical protein